jgi:hypothetical protein
MVEPSEVLSVTVAYEDGKLRLPPVWSRMNQDQQDREESKDAEATLANIGAALVGIQTVEHLIGIALLYVYRTKPLTLEEVERFNGPRKAATLKNLIDQLTSRAEIKDKKFSKLLETYLERRNDFTHGLTTRLGGDLRTTEGRDVANRLSFEVHRDNLMLIGIFSAILRNWELEIGAKDNPDIVSAIAFLSNLCEETRSRYLDSVTKIITPRPQ